MATKGKTTSQDDEKYRLQAMLRNLEITDKARNNVYGEFLTSNAILACEYGAKKVSMSSSSLKYTKIGDEEVLFDKDVNIPGTFGVCKSPKFGGMGTAKTVSVSASESIDGTAKLVGGHNCYMQLARAWGSVSKEVVVYDSSTQQYRTIPTTKSYILCHYGQGCIYPIDSGQKVTINNTQYPINDYKTSSNSSLIGTGASKNYITLAQLNSFKFEYNRQTYINKLTGYTATDFQNIGMNSTAYLQEIQIQLDYLNNEFSSISAQEITSNFNYHIEKYGIGKYDEAVLMFMAITAQESLYGKKIAETWDATLGYAYNQRGGGYSQLTGITSSNQTGNHIPFMTSIGYSNNDISNILDLPFHIATYLPMSSSCYAWTKGNSMGCDITTNIIEYGINQGAEMKLIYLAVSYAINGGYTKGGLQTLLNGKVFSEPSVPPNGWTDRKDSFNDAINKFSHGASLFIAF